MQSALAPVRKFHFTASIDSHNDLNIHMGQKDSRYSIFFVTTVAPHGALHPGPARALPARPALLHYCFQLQFNQAGNVAKCREGLTTLNDTCWHKLKETAFGSWRRRLVFSTSSGLGFRRNISRLLQMIAASGLLPAESMTSLCEKQSHQGAPYKCRPCPSTDIWDNRPSSCL